MTKFILIILLLTTMQTQALAQCKPDPTKIVKFLSEMCWSCMLPLKIAGIEILPGPLPDVADPVNNPICLCPKPVPPYIQIGIPVGFFNPTHYIESVKDPYCFSMFGLQLPNPTPGMLRGNIGSSHDSMQRAFFQSHYYAFPATMLLEIAVDFICLQSDGFDLMYISEVDPLWQDDTLTSIINPEAILFGNPVVNMACIADAIGAQINTPIDWLFWCKGSHGNAYPLSGNTYSKDYVEDAMAVAESMIYKLHREGIAWGTWGAVGLCQPTPMPIWRKSAYRLQILDPVSFPLATTVGQTGLMWSFGKNPPMNGDNFGFLVFKKRECCAF